MIDHGRHDVLGVGVDAVDYEAAVARILDAARERRPLAVTALAVHGVMTGVLDHEQRYRLNHLDLVVPDGQPVRWALGRLHGARLPDRVYGPTLTLKVCAAAAEEGLSVYLYGSRSEVLDELASSLTSRFPKLRLAGRQPSRFRRTSIEERDAIARQIRDSGASLVLVGLGCPRQETWVFEYRDVLRMPLLAVGAAFDFHAGRLPQAPASWQKRGFEWLYRLLQEPRRLWRRYLLLNPLYLTLLGLQWSGLYRPRPSDDPQPTTELLYG